MFQGHIEQPVLVSLSLFLSQQLGHYCDSRVSDLLPLTQSHNRILESLLLWLAVCLSSFTGSKFQTHSHHLWDACHSLIPTTHIPALPNHPFLCGFLFSSSLSSSIRLHFSHLIPLKEFFFILNSAPRSSCSSQGLKENLKSLAALLSWSSSVLGYSDIQVPLS